VKTKLLNPHSGSISGFVQMKVILHYAILQPFMS
jgi:hypothetical protein